MNRRFLKSKIVVALGTSVILSIYLWNNWQDYKFVKKPVTPIAELAKLPVGTAVRVQGVVVDGIRYSTLAGNRSCAVVQSELFTRRMRERNRIEVKHSMSQPEDGFLIRDASDSRPLSIKMARDPQTVWMTRTASEVDDFQPQTLSPDQRRRLDFETTDGRESIAHLGLYYLIEHCLSAGAPITIDGRVERVSGEPILVNGPRGESVVTDLPADEVLLTVQKYEGRLIPTYARWGLNLLLMFAGVAAIINFGRRIRPRRSL